MVKLNVEFIVGAVCQINTAGRIGHRDEGIVDLLPLTSDLTVVMNRIGEEYRLVKTAAKVKNLAGASALLAVFPAGHALHFLCANGGIKRFGSSRRPMVYMFHNSKFLSWYGHYIGIS